MSRMWISCQVPYIYEALVWFLAQKEDDEKKKEEEVEEDKEEETVEEKEEKTGKEDKEEEGDKKLEINFSIRIKALNLNNKIIEFKESLK